MYSTDREGVGEVNFHFYPWKVSIWAWEINGHDTDQQEEKVQQVLKQFLIHTVFYKN